MPRFAIALAWLTFASTNCVVPSVAAQTTAPGHPPTATSPGAAPTPAAPAAALPGTVAPAPLVPQPGAVAPGYAPAAAPLPAQPAPHLVAVPPGYKLVPINGAESTDTKEPPPLEMSYEPGDPIPEDYHLAERGRHGLVLAGAIVGGAAYAGSILGAAAGELKYQSGWLLAPVVGPWIMLAAGGAKEDCRNRDYSGDCQSNAGLRATLAFDGLTQAAGVVLLITGLAVPKTVLVRNRVVATMAPMQWDPRSFGFGAVGTF